MAEFKTFQSQVQQADDQTFLLLSAERHSAPHRKAIGSKAETTYDQRRDLSVPIPRAGAA